jgi:hypothetical protein
MSGGGTGLISGGGMSTGSGGRGMSAGDGCSIMGHQAATTLPTQVPALHADVLIPEVGVRADERGHEVYAGRVLENLHGDASRP